MILKNLFSRRPGELAYNVPSFVLGVVLQLSPADARGRPHLQLQNICSTYKNQE